MKGSMRTAMALGMGYLVGRRRNLRGAMLVAAATAAGGRSVGGILLKRGLAMPSFAEALGTAGTACRAPRKALLALRAPFEEGTANECCNAGYGRRRSVPVRAR